MPYIKPADRAEFMELVSCIHRLPARDAGELNYLFTHVLLAYIDAKGLKYQHINDVVGALEGAKAEFQRRVVAGYEDSKIAQSGDVY